MSDADSIRVEGFMAAAEGQSRDASKPADWLCGFDGYAIGRAANAEREAQERADRTAYIASSEYLAAVEKAKAKARARTRFSGTPRSLDGTGGR